MEPNKTPFFSVGIPVHNSEPYLSKCLESILQQDFNDFEIVCVDDCSTDGSTEIISSFFEKDKRIKVIRHKTNEGILLTRKEIAENSSGKYFIWCDSDDELVPGALSEFYRILSLYNNNDVGIIHSASMISNNGQVSSMIFSPIRSNTINNKDAVGFILANNGLRSFPWIFVLPTKSVLDAFIDVPLFNPQDYVDDALVSYKYFLNLEKIIFVEKSFYKYFLRKNSDSTDPLIIKRLSNTTSYIIDHLEESNKNLKTMLLFLHNLYSAIYYAVGDQARANYAEVNKIHLKLKKIRKDFCAKKYISKKNKIQLLCLKYCPKLFYKYYSKKTTRYSKEAN